MAGHVQASVLPEYVVEYQKFHRPYIYIYFCLIDGMTCSYPMALPPRGSRYSSVDHLPHEVQCPRL